jgi:hypothetical protein
MNERLTLNEAKNAVIELLNTEPNTEEYEHYYELYKAIEEDLKKLST